MPQRKINKMLDGRAQWHARARTNPTPSGLRRHGRPAGQPVKSRPRPQVTERKAEPVDDDVLGPIDYLAVEWPGGQVTGEGFQLLLDLVDRGIVRVLDLEFVAKAADGTVRTVALGDVEHRGDVDVTMWDGASSGLLDQSDVDEVASVIGPGSLAGILVYENVWAVPLMAALDRSSARLLGAGRIVAEDLVTALDATESE
jgi:hypothetical protein